MDSLKGDSELPRLPVLLTVEEAGALLRIGRTKAYAMAREWRETDGQSGLPVIDLGHVLRVPRRALEELVGAEFSDGAVDGRADEAVVATDEKLTGSLTNPGSRRQWKRNRQNRAANQLDLLGTTED
jgi:hypothetical protein